MRQRPRFNVFAELPGDFHGPACPMSERLDRLCAQSFDFAAAFRRDGDDEFRVFAREQGELPDGLAVSGLFDGFGFNGVGCFVLACADSSNRALTDLVMVCSWLGSAGRFSNVPDFQARILRNAVSPRVPSASASISSPS